MLIRFATVFVVLSSVLAACGDSDERPGQTTVAVDGALSVAVGSSGTLRVCPP